MPFFVPTEPFRPAAGLAAPHAQTIFAALLRRPTPPGLHRERLVLPDGDFLDVDHLRAPVEAPHLLLLHGLEGSSRSGYITALLAGAHARGWGAWAINFRSCSGEDNKLARFYHSGETGDVREVLRVLRTRVTGPLVAVGFSLGANVLLKLLAEDADASPLTAAAAVSTPFDLQACADALDRAQGMGAIYRRTFLVSLKRKALAKARRYPGAIDVARVRAARGVQDFDDAVTAPLHGFASAAAYYRESASGPRLAEVRRPTLLLSAADDPMVPHAIPESAAASPWLHVLQVPRGGHVGFVSGSLARPRWWADFQVLRFLEGHLDAATAGPGAR